MSHTFHLIKALAIVNYDYLVYWCKSGGLLNIRHKYFMV